MSKKPLLLLAAALFFALAVWGWQRMYATDSGLLRETLIITRAGGKPISYTVEIASTVDQQAYGLMNRAALAPQTGMIFPFNPPREVAFWMKDTLIPLDMLFIYADGTIGSIAANARPRDLTPVPSREPVAAVIEINGGEAQAMGIAIGDTVTVDQVGKIPPM